jgi:serine protease Do
MTPRSLNLTPTRLVIALAAAGLIGGAGATFFTGSHAHASTAAVSTAAVAPMPQTVAAPDFSAITQRYGPSVVNISVSGVRKVADEGNDASPWQGVPGMSPDDPFFEFFKRFGIPNEGFGPREMPVRGLGSGFIVSADGLILTNAHVVRDAKDVVVKLTDRREFQAKVLGADPKTDVAVLKIDAKNLPAVPLGNVRDLKVGEWVLAIGSPFGFENSVTAGVVSAKGRSLPDESFVPFIQTDVAVNPGNSGGPLFNAQGQVVGINSQIYSRTGGYQGVSFAIPIDLAVQVKDQIVATGKATHARLGVAIQEVNQALADSFKLDRPEGALITSVDPTGPAHAAGLKSGDVIRSVDGKAIVSAGDLPAAIGRARPGDKVTLEIWRHGRSEEHTARLADASDKTVAAAPAEPSASQGKLGLTLRPMQPQERREAGVDNGLLIQDAAGASARAGVQPGDVLLAINGTPVESIAQVRAVVAKSDKSVALLIERDGNKIFVPVRLG